MLTGMSCFSSVPTHQPFEMHPHIMTNFAVHWNHETTVGRIVLKCFSLARLVDQTFYGQSTNLHDRSENGPKPVINAWLV